MSTQRAPQIVLLCPGIGRVRRGMESSVAGMYAELQGSLGAEWHLLTGGPGGGSHHQLPVLARERVPRFVTRLRPMAAFEIEQATFFASCLPVLARLSPLVIYTRDEVLMRLLATAKPLFLRRTRIIYGNGSPMPPPYPKTIALVQHLTQHGYGLALAANEPGDKQRFVPNAFAIPATLVPTTTHAKRTLRQELGLPVEHRILICAAAINRYHKRIDHLIREIARFPDPNLALLLVGQYEAETPALLAAGRAALGERMIVASADPSAMEAYYRAADVFVLPSLVEAFGRVIIEAMSLGLPVIVHDGPSFRETAGCHGVYIDMQRPGALAHVLASAEVWRQDAEAMAARHRWSYERYSWDRLKERYLEMFAACLDR